MWRLIAGVSAVVLLFIMTLTAISHLPIKVEGRRMVGCKCRLKMYGNAVMATTMVGRYFLIQLKMTELLRDVRIC